MLTLTPAATRALAAPPESESQAGIDGMGSVLPVLVDVEDAGPGPCIEPQYGFLDLETFIFL